MLLEIYLSQVRAAKALEIITQHQAKVSSWLLSIEVSIVLRRVLNRSAKDKNLLTAAMKRLQKDLTAISLFDGLPILADRINEESKFARCRALDAIHVASAMLIRDLTGQNMQIATFDNRVADLANSLGLAVVL
ncbi:MAG: PIN domain-containing protein [Deltaproteobacteria bacterium]|nr:PIN domain-containing protein [Deltaproteobacteria bacterium]